LIPSKNPFKKGEKNLAINTTAINDIADTVIVFVPIILLVSIVGWLVETFQKGF